MADPMHITSEPTRVPSGRRRPLLAQVAVVSLVLALVLGAVSLLRTTGGDEGDDGRKTARAAPTPATTTSPATPKPTTAPAPAASGRGYRYIWTGTPGRRFTDREFEAIARQDSLLVLEKGYGSSFADDDAAARRLVSLNPHLTVLVDFLAGALPPVLAERWGSAFKDRWLLRDANGDPIGDCSGGRCSYRVDVADPSYRRFLIGQVLERLRAAPYAGVMYDNLHYYDARRYPQLSFDEIQRLNQGFRDLLHETRRAIPAGDVLFFNGLSRAIGQVPVADRGFDLLGTATGAQDETYCYLDNRGRFQRGRALVADDRRYQRLAAHGSTILESVHLQSEAARADAAHIERYCFAHTLMSFVPGHTFVQFKAFADQGQGPQIRENATPEQRLRLGAPVGTFVQRGAVLRRRFERGWVFVNTGTTPATVSLPAAVTFWNGGTRGAAYGPGDRYTIPPQDAAFFIEERP
jgi:putative glycosyl hydrolase-like family 15 (GHL15) protein